MSRIRQGGGFGFVVLLVVLAAVLFLTSRAWKSVMPSAVAITAPGQAGTKTAGSSEPPPAPVNSGAGQRSIQSSLGEAKQKTDAHSGQVEKALQE